ncbi:ATP-binding protein [Corallococcus sp. RDP092CA]|uniref:hybrid sensor histidine kinase/response regulator n=1 Tax=Corallococcus sp. RDP092CA TaxID=3109369 RepID=UPI0035B2EF87
MRTRILVVDDVPANLVAMEAVLSSLGQDIVCVQSGAAALKELMLGEFSCVLMDVQMPDLDGLETAKLIRSRKSTSHIPLIFITALSRETAYITRGYEQGAADYILKPVDPDILRTKVSVFVELYLRGERLKHQVLARERERRAAAELQRQAELEQYLTGVASHDIRTPLSSILMTSQGQLKLEEALLPPQRQAFERVLRGGKRIQHISDQLMDFTRVRLGGGIHLNVAPCDLNELCARAVDEMRTVRKERVIQCDFQQTPLLGVWDMERLSRVVSNLLDNALKYSPETSTVRVTTHGQADDTAWVEVHNEGGSPIPADLLPTLFDAFRRGTGAQEASTARQSLGLGLFIAKSIVQAHGGTLDVESTAEAGTTFRVGLPRRQVEGGASPSLHIAHAV